MPHPDRQLGLIRDPKYDAARLRVPAMPRKVLKYQEIYEDCNNMEGMRPDISMLGNDKIGDCWPAGTYRASEVWSYDVDGGAEIHPTTEEALTLYSAITGFIPGNPATDRGTDPIAGFHYLLTKGLPLRNGTTSLWRAVFEIDPRNTDDWRQAICEAGVIFFAINCYASFMNVEQGGTWAPPEEGDTIEGGHWIMSAWYPDLTGFWIKSWGMDIFMPLATAAACVQQVYTAISPEWIARTGDTPFGMTEAELQAAAAAFTEAPIAT